MFFELVTQDRNEGDREADDRRVKSWRSTLYTGSVFANSAEFRRYVPFLNAWNESPTRSDPVAKCSSVARESTYFRICP
jgi:hypothetical protein